jgi:CarboxypepD_reg-like domain
MNMKRFCFAILLLYIFQNGIGQTLTQNIKGQVIDAQSEFTLPGANVIVTNTNPVIGTITDANGNFKLENIPVGRHTIQVSFMGYEEAIISEILLGSAKEIILTIPLHEKISKIEEIVIKAELDKSRSLNEMATVSARSFTVEETKRFAASLSDPSRMALSFAGVSTTNDLSNEIVIRGNSSKGLLWRIEGTEVPGPNHFSEEGYSAGFVSILSSNMVGKSDFFTGAFPAEYGNALSGVFDISLRKGNNEKREYAFQFGLMGTEIAAEGPFKKGYNGSYLINYRYSTFTLMDKIGLNVVGDETPNFQDLTFKFHLPTKSFGTFSIWAIGGNSDSYREAQKDTLEWEGKSDRMNDLTEAGMGAGGITNTYFINKKSYIRTAISASGSFSVDKIEFVDSSYFSIFNSQSDVSSTSLRGSLLYNNKINRQTTLRLGTTFSKLHFDYFNEGLDEDDDIVKTYIDQKDNANLFQSFIQAKYKFNALLSANLGLHFQYFGVNGTNSIEPRFGLNYQLATNQIVGLGFGIHSRHEGLFTYFINIDNGLGSFSQPNKNIELPKAVHYVISHNLSISNDFHLKTEFYYQYLFDVPVSNAKNGTESPLNNTNSLDTLISEGLGKNIGIEITFEKFFTKNYYFLITGSLFDSQFKTASGKWYNTRFNIKHVVNFVGGREILSGKNKNNLMGINAKIIWAGGQRYTPIDVISSEISGNAEYFDDLLFSKQYKDYFRIDASIYYRINRPKVSHIISLDIQNATNQLNMARRYFDPDTQVFKNYYQTGTLPILNYKLEF